jgi:hypothetical protein
LINNSLHTAEEKVSELEEKTIETIQNEAQKQKCLRRKKRTSICLGIISNSLI